MPFDCLKVSFCVRSNVTFNDICSLLIAWEKNVPLSPEQVLFCTVSDFVTNFSHNTNEGHSIVCFYVSECETCAKFVSKNYFQFAFQQQ